MKKVLLISLLLSLLYPAFYLIFQLMTPEGFIFSGMVGGDDGTNLAVMASVNRNLSNPWALTEPKNVFLNPNMGSPFLFVPLGYLAKFLGDQFLLVFQISRFLGAFFFLLAVYIFLKEFFGEKRAWRILLLFCFSFGLGGLLFLRLKSLVPDLPYVGMWRPITYELFEGAGLIPITILGRHYYTLPLACGLLSLVFLKESRVVLGGALLALTFLFYPTLGVAFYGISALYLLAIKGLKQNWGRVFLYYLISVLGVLPWVGLYLTDSTMFQFYSDRRIAARPLALFLSTMPHLSFAALVIYDRIKKRKCLVALVCVLVIFLLGPKFPLRSPLRYFSFLGLLGFLVFELREKKKLLFFTLWFFGALFFSVLPPQKTVFFSARFMLVVWLPLVILSYLGIEELVQLVRGWLSVGFLITLLIVLTFPSVIFFTTRFLRKPLEPTVWPLLPDYLFVNEYKAHQFLRDQPLGVVLSSEEIGMNLPILTGKMTVLGREPIVRDHRIKAKDYRRFFNDGASSGDRKSIIKKYGVDYIYFGEYERVVSNNRLDLKKEDFLELVFEKPGMQIFKVR